MAYSGLTEFINALEKKNELWRIKQFIDPVLEITEITDRVSKSGGKALLFENTGTNFPVLINAFGSDSRINMAIGRNDPDESGEEIDLFLKNLSASKGSFLNKLSALQDLIKMAGVFPSRTNGRGLCQQVIHNIPDLGILPVLKCWPHDGGRFITLPMVITAHPETGQTNVGMYRMQVLDKNTTAMHWQRHKTGANHFEAWKKAGKIMPVSVALGGDPVYTYSATAPLPENINEFILAGFLRKKKVKLVKCLTNDLYVPYDADIVIEGYVDPSEDLVWEGPFGDHTGFYSLADWYPKFHVTCITHSKKAVYPATIVGIPPQEDAWLAKATEKIFLAPLKVTIQPEIEDFHMPDVGTAHNLAIVKIRKTYPGQGMKVISSLFGAGQMMFTKYMVVISGDIDIRKYDDLLLHVFRNLDVRKDLLFCTGPLDVLDHSSDNFSFGGKVGIDATIKHPEENSNRAETRNDKNIPFKFTPENTIINFNTSHIKNGIPVLIVSADTSLGTEVLRNVINTVRSNDPSGYLTLILLVDQTVEVTNLEMVVWQVLGNSDPVRDHQFISPSSIIIDGTIKAHKKGFFPRRWPNIVCSDLETISKIDQKWNTLEIGSFIQSPSERNIPLCRGGKDEIVFNEI